MNWFSLQKSPYVPLDVPADKQQQYINNMKKICGTGNRLVIFSGDQKLEHLHEDFYGPDIHPDDNSPEHMFKIADAWHKKSNTGVFATQLGLINQYGKDYHHIRYLVKLNGKTNLVRSTAQDPVSLQLWDVDAVADLQEEHPHLNICGVAYTIYLGSEFETAMLEEAARIINQAHEHGMVACLWIYPRGQAVSNERDGQLIAGATGVAACLGADVVKIHAPQTNNHELDLAWLQRAVIAAGKTKVVISGGKKVAQELLLREIKTVVQQGNAAGIAIGRNIHQRSLTDAVALLNDISKAVYE